MRDKTKKKYAKIFVPAIALILLAMVTGCGMEEIYSAWCDRQIAIDDLGRKDEWKNALHEVAKGEVTVGLFNDEKMLYLRVSTRNQAIRRQIMTTGLTVWFDETGGKRQLYGIRYPLPVQSKESDLSNSPPGDNDDLEREPGDRPEPLREMVQGDMEIFRPEENKRGVISADLTDNAPTQGLRCHIGNIKGSLVYELRVPLIRNDNSYHGIAVNKPKIIGIGLVTGKSADMQQNMGEPGGDQGGRRGHGGGGRPPEGDAGASGEAQHGPPGRNDRHDNLQSLDLWLKVHLAQRP